MRRLIFGIILLLAASGALLLYWFTRPLPILTVTSWAGAYGRAQAAAQMRPYAAEKRVDVHIAQWDGDLAEIEKAVATRTYKGDVIDFELPKAIEACRKGLLERVDAASLAAGADGAPAAQDFVKGALGDCYVGSMVYSQAILFAKDKFSGETPRTLIDAFDTVKFPGPRALRDGAKLNLEMALLADGVAPADIYKTLESGDGVARALKKLDTLRPGLIWWRASSEPARLIASGQAAFATTAWSGDVAEARANEANVIWDHQLYEFDVFGVPKGDPKRDMAMDFIRYATGTDPLAHAANWIALGPARRSSWLKVAQNPDLKIAMAPLLPTKDFATAFAVDDGWWLTHGAALEARFQTWKTAAN
jgi:putative spermidine/putrescine transport system substrate-binding protein